VSTENGRCKLLLAQLSDAEVPLWCAELKKDSTIAIGSAVDGPGRLEQPGVAAAHAQVRRDRYGIWVLPLNDGKVFLNSNPLTAQGEIALVKGDRVRLGSPRVGVDLLVMCSGELAAAASDRDEEAEENSSAAKTSPRKKRRQVAGGAGMLNLTPAEYEIVSWIGRGVEDLEEIAARLFRSVNTVRTQLNRIYDKLDVHSKAELCTYIIQNWVSYQQLSHPLQRVAGTCGCLHREPVGVG
jgi:DNA-binding CsgD family transcriptional regulator